MDYGDDTGIGPSISGSLVLGVGTLSVGGMVIGSTYENGTFVVEQEIYSPELAGARGSVETIEKIIRESASLEISLAEISTKAFVAALSGVTAGKDLSYKYTRLDDIGYLNVIYNSVV